MTDKTVIELSDFDVTGKAMRPASDVTQCFYCQQPIGSKHKSGCVLVQKRAKVRVVIEYEVSVPSHWDSGQIEFHRNEGSWCADNMIDELEQLKGEDDCLCSVAKFEYLNDASKPYLDE